MDQEETTGRRRDGVHRPRTEPTAKLPAEVGTFPAAGTFPDRPPRPLKEKKMTDDAAAHEKQGQAAADQDSRHLRDSPDLRDSRDSHYSRDSPDSQELLLELDDFAAAARKLLPKPIWDYLAGGTGTEAMVDANRAVLDRVWLRPHILTGTSEADTTATLFGSALSAPLGVAPVAHQRLYHPEGEVAAARAAGEAGMLYVTSIFASCPIEDITAASKGPVWQQLYWLRHRDEFERFIARAEAAGVGALVLTVDAPVVARRPRDTRNAFVLPSDVSAVNLDAAVMQTTHEAEPGTSAIARHSAQQFQQIGRAHV